MAPSPPPRDHAEARGEGRRDPYSAHRRSRSPEERCRDARPSGRDSRWRDDKPPRESGRERQRSPAGPSSSRNGGGGGRHGSDRYERPSDAQRSRSPDFARDRERDRAAYDAAAGIGSADARAKQEAEKPNFEKSGLLAAASNNVNGIALKYHEPAEARKPKKQWRLYVFKDGKEVDLLHVSRQSCYLFGRDRTVVDVPLDHPSCSKQHAVLQYRLIIERNEFGDEKRSTKPFLLDLESANGCAVNDQDIPPARFYELKSGDTFTFGASTREYVLLAEE